MTPRDRRFLEAYDYAFGTVFPSFLIPLERLTDLYQKESEPKIRRAYAASILEFAMFAIKSMTKFHRQAGQTRDSVDHFLAAYFPSDLVWELKKHYRSYEEGVLFSQILNPSIASEEAVRTIENSPYAPSALLEALRSVIQSFSRALQADSAADYRVRFFVNYEKIRK